MFCEYLGRETKENKEKRKGKGVARRGEEDNIIWLQGLRRSQRISIVYLGWPSMGAFLGFWGVNQIWKVG